MTSELVWLCPAASLPEGHPCRGKYREQYLEPINEIARAGMAAAAWKDDERLPGLVLTYWFGGEKVRAQVCYSDYPDEQMLGAPDVDLVLKMKYATRFKALYDAHSVPVFPAGFLGGPQRGEPLADGRRWFQKNLRGLRDIGDGIMRSTPPPYHTKLLARGCMDGGGVRGGHDALHDAQFSRAALNRVGFSDHMQSIAAAEFCLNICGNGNSIDRKVVDYCGVGAAILSTRGLEDYVMPGWAQFTHGEDIWFVDSLEALAAAQGMERGLRDKLVLGSRRIYDHHLSPVAMSLWWRECAAQVANTR